jgi:O-antigen ligase
VEGNLLRYRAYLPGAGREREPAQGVPSPLWIAVAGGLIGVELVVAIAVATGVGVYIGLGLLAILLFYLVLRHPSAIAYVAMAWLLFEKSAGAHDPALTNTLSSAGDALLVFALFWAVLVNIMRRRIPILRIGAIGWYLFAFVAISVASTLANGVPLHVAELGILDTLRSLIIFLVIINIGITAKNVHTFVYWVIGIMSASAFAGLLQISPHSPAWLLGGLRYHGSFGLMRVTGFFDHPLSLGDYLALTAPLAICLLAFGQVRGRMKYWLIAGAAVMLLATIFTFAREAWIAIPASLCIVGIAVDRKLLKIVAAPVIILGLLAAPFFTSVNTADSTGGQRLKLFQLTLPLIQSHLLLGAGPGRYGGHIADVTHSPLYIQYHVANFFYGTGNQIDQFWTHLVAETGILGVAAFLSMILACFVLGRRAYLASEDPRRRAIILGLLCAVPTAIILSLVSSVLEEGPAATLFWGLMGMLTVLAMRGDDAVMESEVEGSRLKVEGSTFKVQSSRFKVQGSRNHGRSTWP